MKTWHLESMFCGAALIAAWRFEFRAGSADALTLASLLAAYVGTRTASVSARVQEKGADQRTALVECWPLMRRYEWALFACSMLAACRPFLDGRIPALALAGLTLKLAYPQWRRLYRRLASRAFPTRAFAVPIPRRSRL